MSLYFPTGCDPIYKSVPKKTLKQHGLFEDATDEEYSCWKGNAPEGFISKDGEEGQYDTSFEVYSPELRRQGAPKYAVRFDPIGKERVFYTGNSLSKALKAFKRATLREFKEQSHLFATRIHGKTFHLCNFHRDSLGWDACSDNACCCQVEEAKDHKKQTMRQKGLPWVCAHKDRKGQWHEHYFHTKREAVAHLQNGRGAGHVKRIGTPWIPYRVRVCLQRP